MPYTAVRGFDSHSELYAGGKRFAEHLRVGLTPIVFYLGDHDPSGLAMTGILRQQFRLYARQDVEVRRLALGLDQVLALNLPPNPAKESDSRYRKYVLDTGQTDSWELDALSPTFIDDLLESAIRNLIDADAWSKALTHEELGRDQLRRIADGGDAG